MKVSVVVSCYNEEAVLNKFMPEIYRIFKEDVSGRLNKPSVTDEEIKEYYELIFVNDGSADKTLDILKGFAKTYPFVCVISFSRNFGHEAAMIAGLDNASGDAIICMDSDLQHPVELIPEIAEKIEQGYGVVTMIRKKNKSAGLIKNITSKGFYAVLNRLSSVHFDANASDFFAISKKAANVVRTNYRERTRFLRGFIQDIGFRKTSIEYEAKDRAAGHSKYSIRKLMDFAISALISFSDKPLKISLFFGGFAGFLGIVIMVYTIIQKVMHNTPAGYATIIVVLCFMFAILFILLGIIGEYIGILFKEIKGRPIYIVEDTFGDIKEESCNK